MQEHKKLVVEASKSDKEHQQTLEGLQAAVDSMRTTYEQLQVNLRKFDSNVLQLTKQLDNANTAQKVIVEALEVDNIEKRRLQRRTEAEAEVTQLLGEKKEMEAKLESMETDFITNFHNTKAYTNFSDYFARMAHQEVLAALKDERPDLNFGPLRDRFPPPEAEDE
ncbi:Uncharacterized protein Adt_30894 [Abeliophyllum distichum]|uniref:Uncharacterized protein n=1 Tax=Abeliophyllum distichum TaxID=126358 RepID=A0ABD1RCJ0_9LAMI